MEVRPMITQVCHTKTNFIVSSKSLASFLYYALKIKDRTFQTFHFTFKINHKFFTPGVGALAEPRCDVLGNKSAEILSEYRRAVF